MQGAWLVDYRNGAELFLSKQSEMAGIWFHLNERSTHRTMPRHDYLSKAAQHRFTKDREEVPQAVRIKVVVSCVLYPPPVARGLLVSALRQQSHVPNQNWSWAPRRHGAPGIHACQIVAPVEPFQAPSAV